MMTRSYRSYHPGLMTDMYHPDSAYVAWRKGISGRTTFDLFARKAPFGGAYLLVAGIETALEFIREFHYTTEDLAFLSQIRDYEPEFLDHLANLRFTGDILAIPEGSIAFPEEPIMRVTAPFAEALLIESGILQAINLATLIATKASRVVWASRGKNIAEFALRRAQEPFTVTRASYIGGAATTSFLAAAFKFRLRATGSIPHALIQVFDSEEEAFSAVAETYNRYTILLDTYDVRRSIGIAIRVARDYQERLGHNLAAVRLDSGDFVEDSKFVRAELDAAGLNEVRILVSGDMDEWRIGELLDAGAPIDAFGVGTSIGVGAGSLEYDVEGGSLGGVYKVALYEDTEGRELPKIKLANLKSTWPGKKEIYRIGDFEEDIIQLAHEARPPRGQRLLKPVMRDGKIVPGSLPPLSEIWELAQNNLRHLPDRYHQLRDPAKYPVRYSEALQNLRRETMSMYGSNGRPGVGPGDHLTPLHAAGDE